MKVSAQSHRRTRSPRYIVFDLFHTLVDPEDFRPKGFLRSERVATMLGVDPKAFSSYWSDTLALRNSRPSPVVRLVEEYASKIGKTCPPEIMSQIDYELGRYQDQAILSPRPQVISAIKALTHHGFKLGLLTNCDEREVREWPRSLLSAYFQAACFSFEIGYEKPAIEAYHTVLGKLGASVSETVYVGDGSNNELEGAKAAGFGSIVFMKGFVSQNGLRQPSEIESFQRTADISVDTLEELPNLLKRKLWRKPKMSSTA